MLSYVLHHRVVVNGPSTEMFDRVPSDQRTLIALRTRSRTGAAQVDARGDVDVCGRLGGRWGCAGVHRGAVARPDQSVFVLETSHV